MPPLLTFLGVIQIFAHEEVTHGQDAINRVPTPTSNKLLMQKNELHPTFFVDLTLFSPSPYTYLMLVQKDLEETKSDLFESPEQILLR